MPEGPNTCNLKIWLSPSGILGLPERRHRPRRIHAEGRRVHDTLRGVAEVHVHAGQKMTMPNLMNNDFLAQFNKSS